MDKKRIGYWAVTGLFVFALGMAGVMDVSRGPDIAEAMKHLGYPLYFAAILGTWKLLGAVALVVPGAPRLKEWAYAGFCFNLTGAVVSHVAVGDAGGAVPALVLFTIGAASYALRPDSRRI